MTTVAWDGRYLVSDSQCTNDYILQMPFQKIYKNDSLRGDYDIREYKTAIGLSGSATYFRRTIDYLFYDGPDPEFGSGDDDSVDAIVLTLDGTPWLFSSEEVDWFQIDDRYAVGSGGSIALGAMAAGKSAREAVIIASKYDPHTNDLLQVYDSKTDILTGTFGHNTAALANSKPRKNRCTA